MASKQDVIFLYLSLLLTAERLYLTKMKIYFLFLFSLNFVYFNGNPLNINDVSREYSSKADIGSEIYRKLDEAALRALDLAEEAKRFADDAEKNRVRQDDILYIGVNASQL